jgi:hypothetical protein
LHPRHSAFRDEEDAEGFEVERMTKADIRGRAGAPGKPV